MHNIFNIEDLLNVLIELEITGINQYSKMVDLTSDYEVKELLDILSKQELKHKNIYENFKKEIVNYETSEVTQEYTIYLDAMLNQITNFLKKTSFDTISEAYEMALQLEKETILLLNELKNVFPSKVHKEIDELIAEERKHVVYINKLIKE